MRYLILLIIFAAIDISLLANRPVTILNYYPDCDYKVIGKTNSQLRTTEQSLWNLLGYKQGSDYSELQALFPVDAFDLGYEVSFEKDNYMMKLTFYDNGQTNNLYQMKLSIK